MNQPAGFREALAFPAIGGTALLAIGLYLSLDATAAERLLLDPRAFELEPWRLVTSALLHGQPTGAPRSSGGAIHLFFNLYWMWSLGTVLERALGHLRTTALVVVLAAGSGALQYAFAGAGVGLSGVVYGFVGMLWVLDRHHPRLRGTMPRARVQFFVGWFFFCIALTLADAMPVANVAHGAGALLGVLFGCLWLPSTARRRAAAAGIAALLALGLLGGGVWRSAVNYSEGAWADEFNLGVAAAERDEVELATARFDEATRYPRSPAMAWYGLAWAHARAGRLAAAKAASERSVALDPDNSDYRAALAEVEARLAGETEPPASTDGSEGPDGAGSPVRPP